MVPHPKGCLGSSHPGSVPHCYWEAGSFVRNQKNCPEWPQYRHSPAWILWRSSPRVILALPSCPGLWRAEDCSGQQNSKTCWAKSETAFDMFALLLSRAHIIFYAAPVRFPLWLCGVHTGQCILLGITDGNWTPNSDTDSRIKLGS